MKRTRQAAIDTRSRILDSAEIVFFRNGVIDTSLGDIAVTAGVTRGAIYGHFRNKAALFDAIFERAGLSLAPFTTESIKINDINPLGTLKAHLAMRLSSIFCIGKPRLLYTIAYIKCGYSSDISDFSTRIQSSNRNSEHVIERYLKQAVLYEQISHNTETRNSAYFIHSSLMGIALSNLRDTTPTFGTVNDARDVVDLVFRCVQNNEG
ncbi:TetR family transcriptional regulator [Burkholderia ubonensis]|uniref:TetR family transcriptional regulator n=1 Tax=Burkholderia ubonensis TaxID=101571 RepID=UPI000B502C3C|nr:TetR family transcriptional regulator [Burkholderia ubonensis]